MMRVILAILWGLALFGFWTAQESRSVLRLVRPAKNWPTEVEGLGLDLRQAKTNALKNAQKEVVVCLRRSRPPIKSWIPSRDFIETHIVEHQEAGKDLPLDPGAAKRWVLYLKRPTWDTFYREDARAQALERSHRSAGRMAFLAKALAGLLILFAAVATYVRLDDLTRGYYTRWLQVACAALVAASGVSLWFLS